MTDPAEIIAIGSDHAGFIMKDYLKKSLKAWGYQVRDYGVFSEESMDYPDIVHPIARAIELGEYIRGILLCGSGNGVSMVANKYPHVRAALCWTEEIAKLARQHNDANILSLPARFISNVRAAKLTYVFLHTDFEGGRHDRRVKKISDGLQS